MTNQMKTELQTLAKQINSRELTFAKFKLSYDNDNDSLIVTKGQKTLVIKYNYGADLYNLRALKFRGCSAKEETHEGYYSDMLKPFIQDFFKFEYVMDQFRMVRA